MFRSRHRKSRVVIVLVIGSLLGATAGITQEDLIIRGPYLQSLLEDSVKVVWLTETESIGRVHLRSDDQPSLDVAETEVRTRHELVVTGLVPASEYSYEVLIDDKIAASGEEFRFRTPPRAGTGSFHAVAIGDSGDIRFEDQPTVTAILDELEPDLFLHAGDLLYTGTIDGVFFDEYRDLLRRVGIFPARGNHAGFSPEEWFGFFSPPDVDPQLPACELPAEVCGEDPVADFQIPDLSAATYYSFDWGPVHVAVVDSNTDIEECSAQMRWLCVDLAAANEREIPWKVILLHAPIFPAGLNAASSYEVTRLIPPLADRYGVDLVISGHDHSYQRSHLMRGGRVVDRWRGPNFVRPRGTIYVITGGGGTMLYPELPGAEFRPLLAVFREIHHAVEIEADVDRMVLRAHAPGEDAPFDELSISKTGRETVPGFRRGDTNFDQSIDISDGVALLNALFLGHVSECPPAFDIVADVNSSGRVDIADASFVFSYLFLAGPPPQAPLERCEPSPAIDASDCHNVSCEIPAE